MNTVDEKFCRFIHPFTCIVSGPTQCGKTEWTKNLIKYKNDMIVPPPENIIWSYKSWQPAYEELANKYDI